MDDTVIIGNMANFSSQIFDIWVRRDVDRVYVPDV